MKKLFVKVISAPKAQASYSTQRPVSDSFFPLLELYDSRYVWEQISLPVISVKKLWMCAQS